MTKINAEEAYKKYIDEKKNKINELVDLKKIAIAKKEYYWTKQLLKLITLFNGEKILLFNDKKIIVPKNRSVIFANTHRFKPDFEKITIANPSPSFVIASDFINAYGTINGWYFNTRPTIFVNPYSKDDKNNTYIMMKKYLNAGMNCTIFPEAVWNLSENKIVLDIFTGTVKAALETNSVIIPIAIERYGKKYIINCGEVYDPSIIIEEKLKECNLSDFNNLCQKTKKEMILKCNTILRDKMASLLYEIWYDHAMKFGYEKREKIEENYWENFVYKLTNEWPGYKLQDNVEQQYQNSDDIEKKEMELFLQQMFENPKLNNIFMCMPENNFKRFIQRTKK